MLRIALSPKSDMSISDLRVALFNYILSKQKNEGLIIRIEDIDSPKDIKSQSKEILEILNLFSIDYSQIMYQSENLKYHQKFAMQLLTQKRAFNCFCSDEAIQKDKQKAKEQNQPYSYIGGCDKLSDDTVLNVDAPFSVRIKKPTHNIKFTDLIQGELEFNPLDVDSLTILQQNKTATYNFACAIDDMICDISTIIRDQKYLKDTAKQIYIRESLGYDKSIDYAHIVDIDFDKDDTISVRWLIDQGYLPVAIANYIVLLGYDAPQEIFSIEEAIKWFDISKISTSAAKFDIERLNHINQQYIQNIDLLRLSKILGYADEDIGALAKIYLKQCSTIKQIKSKLDLIFSKKNTLEGFENEFSRLKKCLKTAPFIDEFEDFKKYISKETNLDEKQLSTLLRFAFIGSQDDIDISKIYPLIKNYLGEII